MDRLNHISNDLASQYTPTTQPYKIVPWIGEYHDMLKLKRTFTLSDVTLTLDKTRTFRLMNGKVEVNGDLTMLMKFEYGTITDLKKYGIVYTRLKVGSVTENLSYAVDKRLEELRFGLGVYFGALMAKEMMFEEEVIVWPR